MPGFRYGSSLNLIHKKMTGDFNFFPRSLLNVIKVKYNSDIFAIYFYEDLYKNNIDFFYKIWYNIYAVCLLQQCIERRICIWKT